MPWTESRSRDEWLAEVQRRGTRIRRRRRVGFGVVGALALVLPVSVTAAFLSDSQRAVELSVAGPARERTVEAAPPTGADTPIEPAPAAEPVTTTTPVSPRLEDVPRRLEPDPPVRDVVAPTSPATIPPRDDPVVRSTTTVPPAQNTGSPVLTPNQSTAGAASAGPAAPALTPCPADALQIDVVPSKATFAPGETVSGTFFVQTHPATDCLVAMPSTFRIENVATGAALGSVSATTEFVSPIKADGKMYTSTFSWDPRDCSGPTCTPVPPGLYQAVAEWNGGSAYRGWGEFRIAA